MTEAQPPVFKFGERAVSGARGETREMGGAVGFQRLLQRLGARVGDAVFQAGFAAQHVEHLQRVVFPVGGAVDVAAALQARGEQGDERRLDQPAFLVPRLVPGIGEEDVDAGERGFRQHVTDDLNGIVIADAQIGEVFLGDQLAQRADAGNVNLQPEIVVFRVVCGDLRRRFAHAAADFENFRGGAAKYGVQVERRVLVRHADFRQHRCVMALLRFRHTPGAAHIAFDMAVAACHVFAFLALGGGVDQQLVAHEPISPLVGDDGSAE